MDQLARCNLRTVPYKYDFPGFPYLPPARPGAVFRGGPQPWPKIRFNRFQFPLPLRRDIAASIPRPWRAQSGQSGREKGPDSSGKTTRFGDARFEIRF